MTEQELTTLLLEHASGRVAISDVIKRWRASSVAELDYANLDLERQERCGFPEVILAEGKTTQWLTGLVQTMYNMNQSCFATRVSDEQATAVKSIFPTIDHDPIARTIWLPNQGYEYEELGDLLILTAGTSDLPVAYEARNTAKVMGCKTTLLSDLGVAGIHRTLRHRSRMAEADVIIVCAGMDGALPSVVGGLVDCPVIAVPTSTGYGAAFGGLAALLTMLNSCSAGVVTVNIDAGFKAAYTAARMIRRIHAKKPNRN